MCVHFFNFDHLRITLQSSDLIWGTKFRAPSLPLPPFIFSYLQALIHGFLWWWASSRLIFFLKWHLLSSSSFLCFSSFFLFGLPLLFYSPLFLEFCFVSFLSILFILNFREYININILHLNLLFTSFLLCSLNVFLILAK